MGTTHEHISQAVQTILNRMDSHPEEFLNTELSTYATKWEWLFNTLNVMHTNQTRITTPQSQNIQSVITIFTPEEIEAMRLKLSEIARSQLQAKVLRTLLPPDKETMTELKINTHMSNAAQMQSYARNRNTISTNSLNALTGQGYDTLANQGGLAGLSSSSLNINTGSIVATPPEETANTSSLAVRIKKWLK